MTPSLRDSFELSVLTGDEVVEKEPPPAAAILAMLRRGEAWGEACIYPKADQFPRATVSFHEGHGFVVQCYEDEQSWSDFLVAAAPMSPPQVEIELGGQALERWPPELFVPEGLATEAVQWFLDSGTQKPTLGWVRIDRFPREIVWQGRQEREHWERSRRPRHQGDA